MSTRIQNIIDNFIAGILTNILTPFILAVIPIVIGVLSQNIGLALQIFIIILFIFNTMLLLTQSNSIDNKETNNIKIVSDGVNHYLVDKYDLLRQIDDDATLTYLQHILGIDDDQIETVVSTEIISRRGKDVPKIWLWESPLSEEQEKKRQLQNKAKTAIELDNFIYKNSDKPKIILPFVNKGNQTYKILSATFKGNKLSSDSIENGQKTDYSKVQISINEDLSPGNQYDLTFSLNRSWVEKEINKNRGNLGRVYLSIDTENTRIDVSYAI